MTMNIPTTMKRIVATSLAVAAFAVAGLSTAASADGARLLETDSMVGVPTKGLLLRGVVGGGLPWNIGEASVDLRASGELDIEFEGLVFAAGPNAGKNTIPFMKATVSCLQADQTTAMNVSTVKFPVTVASATGTGGDAEFETTVALPSTCLDPIVLITTLGGAWLATTSLK